ncbi:HAD-IA family hydrolase [Bacteroidaceae bacterium]|jgi:FMN phosphatase YigB (HAD superfamily)|nr:HAD family phosphatase [Bacteroides sp.]
MDSKIKNVIFDLGGVLINLDFDNCLNAFRKAGFQDIEQQACQFRGKGWFSQFELGEISPEEFRNAIRKETSESLSDRKIDDMWNLMLLDIPRQKLDLLLELRGHYMVYLLSNTNQIHWDYACEQMFSYRGFRVNDFFEDTFLSFQMHKAKPDEAIYEQMMKEANILPEETFFIDDSEANCRSAATLGIQSYHYHIGEDLSVLFE